MTVNSDSDKFIPFRKKDILQMLLEDGGLVTEDQIEGFRQLGHILQSIFHFEFHAKLEKLKDCYFPMNPDLKHRKIFSSGELDALSRGLFDMLLEVLKHANYEEISPQEIEQAYNNSALLNVNVRIDMDAFERIQIFYRGRRTEQFELKKLKGLKKRRVATEVLERVVLLVRFKPRSHFENRRQKFRPLNFEPGSTLIKLFKDVPKEDIEILFPNCRVTMSVKDKLMLTVPAIAGGIPLLATKVMPAFIVLFVMIGTYFGVKGTTEEANLKQVIALFGALGALGGFCLKQWMKYKNKRYAFQKELSDNLYFRNLVNNVGVFHSLIDAAEEEECKEAFLAYYFLITSETPLTAPRLDAAIEQWFVQKHDCHLNFDVGDAVGKLVRMKLVSMDADGRLKAITIQEALERLDVIWDGYFRYAGAV